jgi:dTDP-4-amino-4,6-dideoxygalactose transaminase
MPIVDPRSGSVAPVAAATPARLPVAAPTLPAAEGVLPYLQRIDASGWYSNFGPLVQELEARLASRFVHPTEVVTVANGTLALTLALQALDLPRGGFCAIPSWTFVATAHAVRMAGLTPWFVDVEPEGGELTPGLLARALPRAPGPVVATLPVSVMGHPTQVEAWAAFQDATGLPVILDAAAGFDAVHDAAITVMVSLHATKALGIGEGAFLATRDPALARRWRALTNFAFMGDRIARHPATNAKLSEYAAAVGLAALDIWPDTRNRYIAAARRLRIALSDEPRVCFQPGWGLDWISSTCLISLPEGSAEDVEMALARAEVETRRWWGQGCHAAPAFADCPADRLEATQRLSGSTLGVPFFARMKPEQINRVARALKLALDSHIGEGMPA